MDEDEITHKHAILAELTRRKRIREQQKAKAGPLVDPLIVTDLEDINREIREIVRELITARTASRPIQNNKPADPIEIVAANGTANKQIQPERKAGQSSSVNIIKTGDAGTKQTAQREKPIERPTGVIAILIDALTNAGGFEHNKQLLSKLEDFKGHIAFVGIRGGTTFALARADNLSRLEINNLEARFFHSVENLPNYRKIVVIICYCFESGCSDKLSWFERKPELVENKHIWILDTKSGKYYKYEPDEGETDKELEYILARFGEYCPLSSREQPNGVIATLIDALKKAGRFEHNKQLLSKLEDFKGHITFVGNNYKTVFALVRTDSLSRLEINSIEARFFQSTQIYEGKFYVICYVFENECSDKLSWFEREPELFGNKHTWILDANSSKYYKYEPADEETDKELEYMLARFGEYCPPPPDIQTKIYVLRKVEEKRRDELKKAEEKRRQEETTRSSILFFLLCGSVSLWAAYGELSNKGITVWGVTLVVVGIVMITIALAHLAV